jgi:hypothetical protein
MLEPDASNLENGAHEESGEVRKLLLVTCRVSLAISLLSTIYLLFIFGHSELAPLGRIVAVASVAGASALVGGLLQWVGLPPDPKQNSGKKTTKKRPPSA